jgi:hypothetical protein
MRYYILLLLIPISTLLNAQMYNDTPFNAHVAHPKYGKENGPNILIDAGHHNFIVEMDLIKPLVSLVESDGYRTKIDSSIFTKDYLSKYKVLVIMPAMPFKFGSKSQVTDEVTFTTDELNILHDWVVDGGSLLMFSEHAPIDKSVTPLFNKFDIQVSIGIVSDSLNCDSTIKVSGYKTLIKYNKTNGLLNQNHPITIGANKMERIHNIVTYGGCGLNGAGYTNILQLAPSAIIKKYNGSLPSGSANSQCLAGNVGKGKLVALGDCNGFTAMYIPLKTGEKYSTGMQVANYDWKQFVLNTFHWLSK